MVNIEWNSSEKELLVVIQRLWIFLWGCSEPTNKPETSAFFKLKTPEILRKVPKIGFYESDSGHEVRMN